LYSICEVGNKVGAYPVEFQWIDVFSIFSTFLCYFLSFIDSTPVRRQKKRQDRPKTLSFPVFPTFFFDFGPIGMGQIATQPPYAVFLFCDRSSPICVRSCEPRFLFCYFWFFLFFGSDVFRRPEIAALVFLSVVTSFGILLRFLDDAEFSFCFPRDRLLL